jgi:hypothetical protein
VQRSSIVAKLALPLLTALQTFLGPWPVLSVSCTQSLELFGRGISPSQVRYLHGTTQTQNKRTRTSMAWVGFEPTIPVFEQAKTFHALDHAATVIGFSKTPKHCCYCYPISNEIITCQPTSAKKWIPYTATQRLISTDVVTATCFGHSIQLYKAHWTSHYRLLCVEADMAPRHYRTVALPYCLCLFVALSFSFLQASFYLLFLCFHLWTLSWTLLNLRKPTHRRQVSPYCIHASRQYCCMLTHCWATTAR